MLNFSKKSREYHNYLCWCRLTNLKFTTNLSSEELRMELGWFPWVCLQAITPKVSETQPIGRTISWTHQFIKPLYSTYHIKPEWTNQWLKTHLQKAPLFHCLSPVATTIMLEFILTMTRLWGFSNDLINSAGDVETNIKFDKFVKSCDICYVQVMLLFPGSCNNAFCIDGSPALNDKIFGPSHMKSSGSHRTNKGPTSKNRIPSKMADTPQHFASEFSARKNDIGWAWDLTI